jgi:excisionase family DNA binding protein
MIDRSKKSGEVAPVAKASAPVAEPAPEPATTPAAAASPAKKSRKSTYTPEERLKIGNFTIPQCAELLGCSVSTVNKLMREKRLAYVKYGKGCTRIPGPALASLLRGE